MTGLLSTCSIVSADSNEGRPMAVLREINFFLQLFGAIGILRSAGCVGDSRSVILVDGDREAAP
jgi:hypothetical protein